MLSNISATACQRGKYQEEHRVPNVKRCNTKHSPPSYMSLCLGFVPFALLHINVSAYTHWNILELVFTRCHPASSSTSASKQTECAWHVANCEML